MTPPPTTASDCSMPVALASSAGMTRIRCDGKGWPVAPTQSPVPGLSPCRTSTLVASVAVCTNPANVFKAAACTCALTPAATAGISPSSPTPCAGRRRRHHPAARQGSAGEGRSSVRWRPAAGWRRWRSWPTPPAGWRHGGGQRPRRHRPRRRSGRAAPRPGAIFRWRWPANRRPLQRSSAVPARDRRGGPRCDGGRRLFLRGTVLADARKSRAARRPGSTWFGRWRRWTPTNRGSPSAGSTNAASARFLRPARRIVVVRAITDAADPAGGALAQRGTGLIDRPGRSAGRAPREDAVHDHGVRQLRAAVVVGHPVVKQPRPALAEGGMQRKVDHLRFGHPAQFGAPGSRRWPEVRRRRRRRWCRSTRSATPATSAVTTVVRTVMCSGRSPASLLGFAHRGVLGGLMAVQSPAGQTPGAALMAPRRPVLQQNRRVPSCQGARSSRPAAPCSSPVVGAAFWTPPKPSPSPRTNSG